MGTRGQWGTDLAKAAGNSNPSEDTVKWIAAWTKGENTSAVFNPLATTLDYGENTCFNSVCVRNYKTRQQGIEATLATLRGPYPGYSDILNGIRTNNPAQAAAGLIRAPWGTNGALVQNIWLLYDVRNETLLSESGQSVETVSGGSASNTDTNANHTGDQTTHASANSGHDAGQQHYNPGLGQNPMNLSFTDTHTGLALSTGNRIYYMLGGSFLLAVTLVLAVRQYVPTKQIVETVAAVA